MLIQNGWRSYFKVVDSTPLQTVPRLFLWLGLLKFAFACAWQIYLTLFIIHNWGLDWLNFHTRWASQLRVGRFISLSLLYIFICVFESYRYLTLLKFTLRAFFSLFWDLKFTERLFVYEKKGERWNNWKLYCLREWAISCFFWSSRFI